MEPGVPHTYSCYELSSLENVRDISLLEQLSLRLPDLVSSPLSVNALRDDLQISH